MENIKVQKRDFTVKAKKLRRLGVVPGSVFGKSLPGIYFDTDGRRHCTQAGSRKT